MKNIRAYKAAYVGPHSPRNANKTWRDIERYLRQRRRRRKNHTVNGVPEGNTRRIMRDRAGLLLHL